MQNNPLYKKAVFQASRRAMLENEDILKKFVEEVVFGSYDDEKLTRLNKLLADTYDNDLFDIFMGQKRAEFFADKYDIEILKEIESYAVSLRDSSALKKMRP